VIPHIRLDRHAPISIQSQLHDGLRRIIVHGRLECGVQLPSTRRLAKALGVSRNAVLFAYEALAAEGLVEGTIGSGTRVVDTTVGFSILDPDGHSLNCFGKRSQHYNVSSRA
jgi:DNA-binding FadR family transcriptional regulator